MFSAVATNRARTRTVPWVNQDHGNSRTFGFVEDKLLQLIEAPVSKLKTHLSVKTVSSLSDTAKVFKSECLTEPYRSIDKSAADVVIHPLGEPRLAVAQPSKVAFRRLRTTFLKPSTEPSQGSTNLAGRFSAVLVPFAIRGNLNNAKVNTNRAGDGAKRMVLHVANRHEVELTIHENEIGFSPLPLKKFDLVLATRKGDMLPACDGPDRNLLLFQHVSQDSGVIGDGPVRPKGALCELVPLVSISDLCEEQCNDLCCQSGFVAQCFVPLVVQVKAFEGAIRKGPLRNPVSGLVGGFQRFLECFLLLRTRQELDLCNELHHRHFIKQKSNSQERA